MGNLHLERIYLSKFFGQDNFKYHVADLCDWIGHDYLCQVTLGWTAYPKAMILSASDATHIYAPCAVEK